MDPVFWTSQGLEAPAHGEDCNGFRVLPAPEALVAAANRLLVLLDAAFGSRDMVLKLFGFSVADTEDHRDAATGMPVMRFTALRVQGTDQGGRPRARVDADGRVWAAQGWHSTPGREITGATVEEAVALLVEDVRNFRAKSPEYYVYVTTSVD